MLLPHWVFWVVLIGVPLIGAIIWEVGPQKIPKPAARIIGGIVFGGGLLGACGLHEGNEVVIFRGTNQDYTMSEYYLIGSTKMEIDGKLVDIAFVDKPGSMNLGLDNALYVNATDATLILRTISYGMSFGGGGDDRIPVGTTFRTYGPPDNFGPGDRPPSSVSSTLKFDSRRWVTW